MGSDFWLTGTVGDLAAPKRNALVGGPFGSNLVSADYALSGVPVIRGQNMGWGRWVSGEFVFVSAEKAEELSANIAVPGDLIFTQRGTLGQVAIVPEGAFDRYVVSQSQMKLSVDESKADSLFLYYLFTGEEQQDYIRRNAIQTGVPHTNLGILRDTPIRLPSRDEQAAIGRVLGCLDSKIEVNQKLNQTLEVFARAIFKSWFVDFDPVREGHQLFPRSLGKSALGSIPEGWKATELGTLVEVIDCLHSKKPERKLQGRPLLQLSNILDNGLLDMTDTYFISEDDYKLWTSRMEARVGDCVITNVGRVGAVAQIPEGLTVALGRNMTGLRCRRDFPYPTFLVECLLSSAMREEITSKVDAGTILESLNVRNIPRLRVIEPAKPVAAEFERICRPLRAKMEGNLEESRSLAALRDALLPKLLSDEIRVKQAEKIVGEAV